MAKRFWLGFGGGRSEFDVLGRVYGPDGTLLGEFTESRAGGGWGEEGALRSAMERTANTVSEMIRTGAYRLNAPKGRPAAAAFLADHEGATAGAPPNEDRLRALEWLRTDGMLTEEEYKAKRQQILDAL